MTLTRQSALKILVKLQTRHLKALCVCLVRKVIRWLKTCLR